jgi:hypothetical protein
MLYFILIWFFLLYTNFIIWYKISLNDKFGTYILKIINWWYIIYDIIKDDKGNKIKIYSCPN